MAEKEERIVIKKQINYHPPYGGWCGDGKEIVLTRQEAIEKMAKALHKESTRISNMEKDFDKLPADWRKSFYNYAEAALNALLGDK